MYLIINPHETIAKTNNNFQLLFGYLKLQVYSEVHAAGQVSSDTTGIDPQANWESIGVKETIQIEFDQSTSVSDFEARFKKLGIGVQVLRKSKELWLQTSTTDSWTLEEQDRHAREFSNATPDENEPLDFREQE